MEKRTEGKNGSDQKRFCPFRVNTKVDHVFYEGAPEPVVISESFEYAECYKEGCPFWQYEPAKGFYCRQVDMIGGNYYVSE